MVQDGEHTDDIQKLFSDQESTEPKNPRLSIHNKYKRRLRRLSLHLADFIFHAEQKLAGNIYKREEIEAILAKAKELAALLPAPEDAIDSQPVRDDLLEVLQSDMSTGAIVENANNFLASLSKDDWDELMQSYRRDDPREPGK